MRRGRTTTTTAKADKTERGGTNRDFAPSHRPVCVGRRASRTQCSLPRTPRREERASLDELQLPRDIQSVERVVSVRLALTRVRLLRDPPAPACCQPCAGSSGEAPCMAFEVRRYLFPHEAQVMSAVSVGAFGQEVR